MPYQKFKADYIFTGTEMLHRNHVLITDEHGFVESIVDLDYHDLRVDIMNAFYEKHCTIKEDLNNYDLPFGISTIDYTKIPDDEVFEFIKAIGINFYCIKSGEYMDYLS